MFCIQRPVSSLLDEDSTKSSIHEDQVKIGMYLHIPKYLYLCRIEVIETKILEIVTFLLLLTSDVYV